jgi:hypothetical protein
MTWEQVRLSLTAATSPLRVSPHVPVEKYYKKDPASFKKEIYLSKRFWREAGRKIKTMIYPTLTAIRHQRDEECRIQVRNTIKAGMTPLPLRTISISIAIS